MDYINNKYNNAQYNFLRRNENFAEVFNASSGFKLVDPSTLRDCDSREIAMILKETSAALGFSGKKSEVDSNLKLSMERIRDLKKMGVMKSDGNFIYFCIENQSTKTGNMRERINLYNAISYMKPKGKDGRRIPVITCLVGWDKYRFERDMWAFDDYNVGENSQIKEFLPHYRIPVINMMDISDEQLQGMNDDIKFAVMALKCSDGNMEVSEKMIIFEKIDEIRKKVSEDAFNLALCYTNLKDKGKEIMDSGFAVCYDQFVQYGRQEGRREGRQEGRREGRREGRLEGMQNGIQLGTYRTLFKLVEDGDISLEKAANKAGLTVNEFLEKKKELSGI